MQSKKILSLGIALSTLLSSGLAASASLLKTEPVLNKSFQSYSSLPSGLVIKPSEGANNQIANHYSHQSHSSHRSHSSHYSSSY
ncbi:MAG: hypothetical protein EBR67_07200 [Proteobacteria bacterium]|nr:hypothetical protein [Pseudomonadota bacterium]